MAIVTSRGFLDAGSAGRLPTKEGGTVKLGGVTREPVMGDEGVLGFSETTNAPHIKVTLVDTTALDKEKLKNFVGETLVYSLNNGQQYVLTDAFIGNELELNIKSGTLDVEFYGTECIQQA